jgi:hypothetical protein
MLGGRWWLWGDGTEAQTSEQVKLAFARQQAHNAGDAGWDDRSLFAGVSERRNH